MKTLVICKSIAYGNTHRLAEALADELNAELKEPKEISPKKIKDYDIVGFGSGIYGFRHHKSLLEFVDKLPDTDNKPAFIYSTSVFNKKTFHNTLRNKLEKKGFNIVGEFHCQGAHNKGPFKLVGGAGKGHPDEKDLKDAREFAEKMRDANEF